MRAHSHSRPISIALGMLAWLRWLAVLLAAAFPLLHTQTAAAQELSPGNYYWYVPEHEKAGRTNFYSQPTFSSGMVRVNRAQRFKLLGGSKGWGAIEFDYAGKAYVHLRILRVAMYDPTASDPWYEFKRASVFYEEPAKMEARLNTYRNPAVQATDSKTPSWKRYKDNWNIKPTRTPQVVVEGTESTGAAPVESTRPIVEKKARNKYPLLPPIGTETPKEAATPEAPLEPEAAPRP